ncbi:hypothetical protein Bhyg_06565 [Pseudolycoriella hygida]|uniref:Uncharacterized protein n=1 Tax=Pseudolycoriella hygida TaxID=35572 RepID=A0A9Q0S330_9DIPT|nr:hypothetical protein Bhyg_06565 [Pseudolycoriella hygida]
MDNLKIFIGNVMASNKTSLQASSSVGGDMTGRKRSESLCSNASDGPDVNVSMNSISNGRKIERKDSKDNEPYFYIIW